MSYQNLFSPATDLPVARPAALDRRLTELLLVLQRRGQGADFGLVPRNTCRVDMGMDGFELDALLRRARQRGLVDTGLAYDHVALTRRGADMLAAGHRF
ncbi:hypothetical protein L2U69_01380 [Zavarzinia compransoris]|uniref:hypothetical protein n=1 Tax=Zavarzinia marina TaxID=2911065 RepID=UPI001F3E3071|nr:hypothetical protein [Zavarzinia marina]MCF4164296.1 hypothetical protein [Zavarzinia marina]